MSGAPREPTPSPPAGGAPSPSPAPLVSIVVVTYNAFDYVRRCFASLHARTSVPFELVVVDNLSEPPLRAWLEAECDAGRIDTLVLNDENRLWAPGANQGLAAARADTPYLLLLNPDTEALVDGWLSRLIALLESREQIGLVGPQQVWLPWGPVFGGVDGHCLLMRRVVYALTGGIDEAFPWWGGGMKLNAAAWALGYRFAILDDPVLVHYEGRSNAEREEPVAGELPEYDAMLRSVGIEPYPANWFDRWRRRRARRRRKRLRAELIERVRAVVAGEA